MITTVRAFFSGTCSPVTGSSALCLPKFALAEPFRGLAAVGLPGFLSLHAAVWTVLPAALYPNLPLDLIEALVYGREWQLGYDKLPLCLVLVEVLYGWWGTISPITCWRRRRWWRDLPCLGFDAALAGTRGALVAVVILDGLHYFNYTPPSSTTT